MNNFFSFFFIGPSRPKKAEDNFGLDGRNPASRLIPELEARILQVGRLNQKRLPRP